MFHYCLYSVIYGNAAVSFLFVISCFLFYTWWCIKNWTILLSCLQGVDNTHTENFYNIYTVPKTLIKMLFDNSTLRCNN